MRRRLPSSRSGERNAGTLLSLAAWLIPAMTATVFAQAAGGADILAQISEATARVAEQASPAVVGIWVDIKPGTEQTALEDPSRTLPNPFSGQSSPPSPQTPQTPQKPKQFPQMQPHEQALGSGFIVSKDGYILTNNHVVGNADLMVVRSATASRSGRKSSARTRRPTWPSSRSETARSARTAAGRLGQAARRRLGASPSAPFGLTHTVTSGHRQRPNGRSIALGDLRGLHPDRRRHQPRQLRRPAGQPATARSSAINTAILGSEGNIGIGFAIPANMAKDVYEQIVKTGTVIRGFLGVDIQELTPDLATAFGLPADVNGIVITHVAPNSPAEKAGLRPGDVITQFDGRPVRDAATLQSQIAAMKPGSQVSLVAMQDGKANTITVQLGSRPAQARPLQRREKSRPSSRAGDGRPGPDAGIGRTPQLPGRCRRARPGRRGQLHRRVSGFDAGMLIQEVNRQPVKNMKEFEHALEAAAQKPPVLFLVNNQGSTGTL